MFKGKVYLSRIDGSTEERFEREFDSEKEYHDFVDNNPDLVPRKVKWNPIVWPDGFVEVQRYLDSITRIDRSEVLDEMEEDMKRFFETSRKLLSK